MALFDMIGALKPEATTALEQVDGAITWAQVAEQVDQLTNTIEILEEAVAEAGLADVELAFEDREWRALGFVAMETFSRAGFLDAARLCRVMAVVNPLIKRGLALRTAYVWGKGGVSVQARAAGPTDDAPAMQDVNAVVQAFWDDKATRKVLSGATARETNERTLGTDGMLAVALFTKPLTGRVQPRLIPTSEIADVIRNPDDATEVWFYKRVHSRRTYTGVDGAAITDQVTTFYPDVDYRPRGARPTRVRGAEGAGAASIMWDAPIAFLKVNALPDWDFGIGDAFAAIPWARAYKEFLEDWAKLMKSLSRFAWRMTSSTKGRAQRAATAIAATAPGQTGDSGVGAVANGGPGMGMLEAIPKSGATIDSESGKPLAAMVAAGMDVPVTMLLTDPGITGARATAETLDTPTELMAGGRRDVWTDFLDSINQYVIDQQVKAPRGDLKGTVTRDEWDREVIELAGDTPRTIDYDWPDLTEISVKDLVEAVAAADATGKMPPLTTVRLLLQALGVRDVDELLAQVTDENGEWVDPDAEAGQAAVDAFRRGEDPAEALR